MIAALVVQTGFPPEVFGVPSSVELGEAIIDLFAQRTTRSVHAEAIAAVKRR